MRCLWGLDDAEDDKFGRVWLAKNVGRLDGVGCGLGGDDALAALVEPDTCDIDEMDAEHKALHIRAKACVGVQMLFLDGKQPSSDTLALLHQCADADDWLAAEELGAQFLFETDDPQKHSEGMKLLEKAVQLGSGHAMLNIGTAFERGIAIKHNRNIAIYWWQCAAECGIYDAYASLGDVYCKLSVDSDKTKAFLFCALAADAGIPLALKNVGNCYENGIGVAQNQQTAFEFYNKAYCASREEMTVSDLARCLIKGIGTKQDVKKGMELLNEGVKASNPNVMYTLGQLLVSDDFIERDEERGLDLLKRAAAMGNLEAKLYFTSDVNECLNFEVIQQDTLLFPYLKFTLLGFFYLNDERLKNSEMAFDYFKRGVQGYEHHIGSFDGKKCVNALQDESVMVLYDQTLKYLGKCYQDGIGTPVNKEEAVKCYERGVSLNFPLCTHSLAECYEKGICVKQDEKKAFELFERVVDLDEYEGVLSLARCYEKGVGVKQDANKAFELFKRASDLKQKSGSYNLARCYENGIGVEVNLPKAMELYHRASNFGSSKAKERLEALSQYVSE